MIDLIDGWMGVNWSYVEIRPLVTFTCVESASCVFIALRGLQNGWIGGWKMVVLHVLSCVVMLYFDLVLQGWLAGWLAGLASLRIRIPFVADLCLYIPFSCHSIFDSTSFRRFNRSLILHHFLHLHVQMVSLPPRKLFVFS